MNACFRLPALSASLLLTLVLAASLRAQVLFSSNLDSSTGWVIRQEGAVPGLAAFGHQYQGAGIPPSPHGGGSATGLRMAANANGAIQAITAATTATFSGTYVITFDFWGNTWGQLPAGGNGSTEFLGGGAGFSGTLPRKGASMLMSIEGNSTGADWRLDKDVFAQALSPLFYNPLITSLNITAATSADPSFFFTGPFPARTAPAGQELTSGLPYNGTIAFGWHTMVILADSVRGTAEFWVDRSYIGTLSQAGGPVDISGAGSLTLLDPFPSASDFDLNRDLVCAIFDNYRVEQPADPKASGFSVNWLQADPVVVTVAGGHTYQFLYSTDLQTWTALGTPFGTSTQRSVLLPPPPATASRLFLRAETGPF